MVYSNKVLRFVKKAKKYFCPNAVANSLFFNQTIFANICNVILKPR